ncbi:hypothetical protein CRU87_00760 [Aliarcobacter trophiarum LMG 25534]|uniref:GLUG domain-containing protein n=1 Tax=Aliarcobacter trophiarum LMG 25534 TaxID=1032241 RepID=A0ABY0EYL5_9BACT|nr:GLUG motif-containing protein [Aliarcobacter trophiarum]RXJ93050.1 hypothetical protein CRU87_00760 [Aliarcobacter trophiarum LMG 25534]
MNFNKEYKNRFRILKGGLVSLVISSCLYGAPSGGLVGGNENSSISNSYATGEVSGENGIGGLVGLNSHHSTIENSYATGDVFGEDVVGGFAGYNERDI